MDALSRVEHKENRVDWASHLLLKCAYKKDDLIEKGLAYNKSIEGRKRAYDEEGALCLRDHQTGDMEYASPILNWTHAVRFLDASIGQLGSLIWTDIETTHALLDKYHLAEQSFEILGDLFVPHVLGGVDKIARVVPSRVEGPRIVFGYAVDF